jgi:hypothetical protein
VSVIGAEERPIGAGKGAVASAASPSSDGHALLSAKLLTIENTFAVYEAHPIRGQTHVRVGGRSVRVPVVPVGDAANDPKHRFSALNDRWIRHLIGGTEEPGQLPSGPPVEMADPDRAALLGSFAPRPSL